MLKRISAVAALSLIPTTVAVAPAHAARSCGISVPSKVSITSPYRTVTARFSEGCRRYAEFAAWDVVHPSQGYVGAYAFDGASTDSMDLYDWEPLGRLSVRPDFAYDTNYDDMIQNTSSMTVKLGSRVSASSSRTGSYVTITGNATRYSPAAGTYRPWSGAKVSLRQKSCSSCEWRYVKSATTSSTGSVRVKTYASSARYWQIATVDTSNTWGRASATMTR